MLSGLLTLRTAQSNALVAYACYEIILVRVLSIERLKRITDCSTNPLCDYAVLHGTVKSWGTSRSQLWLQMLQQDRKWRSIKDSTSGWRKEVARVESSEQCMRYKVQWNVKGDCCTVTRSVAGHTRTPTARTNDITEYDDLAMRLKRRLERVCKNPLQV